MVTVCRRQQTPRPAIDRHDLLKGHARKNFQPFISCGHLSVVAIYQLWPFISCGEASAIHPV